MKRMSAMLLVMLFLLLVGCSAVGTETDYPAAIMAEGTVYLKSVSAMPAEIDESAIIGYTTSYTDTYPEKDGETNFNRELNMPYARVEGGIAVLYENEWYLCRPKDEDAGAGGGTISFYAEPTREGTDPVDFHCSTISKKQAAELRKIIDDVDTWVNDALVDRLAYYFDGHIEFAGDKKLYYFSYEYNVIYFSQQFAEIPAEDMQVIKDIAIARGMPVDLHLEQPGSFSYCICNPAAPSSEKSTQGHFLCAVGRGPVSSPVSGVDWFKLFRLQSFRCPSPRVWNNYQRHRICAE